MAQFSFEYVGYEVTAEGRFTSGDQTVNCPSCGKPVERREVEHLNITRTMPGWSSSYPVSGLFAKAVGLIAKTIAEIGCQTCSPNRIYSKLYEKGLIPPEVSAV